VEEREQEKILEKEKIGERNKKKNYMNNAAICRFFLGHSIKYLFYFFFFFFCFSNAKDILQI
jgi:hypothetical protein